MVRMPLDLIHGRHDAAIVEVLEVTDKVVGHANRLELTGLVELDQCGPRAIPILRVVRMRRLKAGSARPMD